MAQNVNSGSDDEYDLNRFFNAQENMYLDVLSELNDGKKRSHWMWFIFPQIAGLGRSDTAKYYAIKNQEEARAYLNHPVLGMRLQECAEIVLNLEGKSIPGIFGYPDDRKFKSSMTLFSCVADQGSIFERVLNKYFHGERDTRTLELLR